MKNLGILLALFFVGSGQALPLTSSKPWVVPTTFTQNYDFEGIVALDDCSAALVRFETSLPTDPAMVLTNGHCLETGMPDAGTYVYGAASDRSLGLMNSSAQVVAQLPAVQILYSTMTGTDITLYRLGVTFAAIEQSYGIHALTLSSQHAQVGQALQVISGYWQRGYTCAIEAFIPQLKEGEYTWIDSMRYTRPGCDTIGGTSGSPVLAAGTRTVIGINNTGNESGEKCTDDNPCEIDAQGQVTWQKGYDYGEEILDLYSCLNANRDIDLTISGCRLAH